MHRHVQSLRKASIMDSLSRLAFILLPWPSDEMLTLPYRIDNKNIKGTASHFFPFSHIQTIPCMHHFTHTIHLAVWAGV